MCIAFNIMRCSLSCLVRRSNTKLLIILLVICILSIIVLLAYWLILVSSMRPNERRYMFEESYHGDESPGDQDTVIHAASDNDPIVDVRAPTKPNVNVTTIAIGCAITTSHSDELSLENLAYQLPFLKTLVPSFCRTASAGYQYLFYISFDARDPHLGQQEYLAGVHARFTEIVDLLCPRKSKVTLHFVLCRHDGNPTWAQNDAMMEAYLDNIDYYYRVNDDTQMLSPGWTETFIDGLQGFSPSNVGVVGPLHKGGNEAILTYDFVHRTHIDIFGYYYPRVFTDWWADNWMTMVYGERRTLKLPSVRLLHTSEAGTRYEVKKNKELFLNEQVEEDQTTLSRYLQAVEKARSASSSQSHGTTRPVRRVISMSLWGAKTRYTFGALRNAQLAKVYYPGWTLRIYVERVHSDGSTNFSPTPERLLNTLERLGVELVSVDAERSRVPPMMWRFLIADDIEVDAFIVRDSDCRLTDRDAAVVNEWLETSAPYHCVRDHPSHQRYPVLGGLWGGRPKALGKLISVPWRDLMMGHRSDYAQDMNFLANAIWPKVSQKAICHDSVSCEKWKPSAQPFPVERIGTEHLGQVFDAFGNVHDEDVQILLDHRPLKECTVQTNKTTTIVPPPPSPAPHVNAISPTDDFSNSSITESEKIHGIKTGSDIRSSEVVRSDDFKDNAPNGVDNVKRLDVIVVDIPSNVSQRLPDINEKKSNTIRKRTSEAAGSSIESIPSDVRLNVATANHSRVMIANHSRVTTANRSRVSARAPRISEEKDESVATDGRTKGIRDESFVGGTKKLIPSDGDQSYQNSIEVANDNLPKYGEKFAVNGDPLVLTQSESNRGRVTKKSRRLRHGNETNDIISATSSGETSNSRKRVVSVPSDKKVIVPSDGTNVVVWSMDYHVGPVRALKSVVSRDVRFVDKSLAAGCARYDTCARDLRVITRANGLQLTPAIIESFHEEYESDPEMSLVTHFLCTYPVALCELYVGFGRPIVVYVNSRYEQGHYTANRWTRWNKVVATLVANGNNHLVASSLYDARYVQYFTGILPQVIPLVCAYVSSSSSSSSSSPSFVRNRDVNNVTVLLADVHNPIFTDAFRQIFNRESQQHHQSLTLLDSSAGRHSSAGLAVSAVVHIPRQTSTTDFCEHYSADVPIFVPSVDLAIRWHKRYGILSRLTWNSVRALMEENASETKNNSFSKNDASGGVGSPIAPAAGFEKIPDPNRIAEEVTLRYWLPLTDFYQRPNITRFDSVADLIDRLRNVNLLAVATAMEKENEGTKSTVEKEWRRIFRR